MRLTHLFFLGLCCAVLGCTSLNQDSPSDGGAGQSAGDPDAGELGGDGGESGTSGSGGMSGGSGGEGGSGGPAGEGGMSGAGAMGGEGGMNPSSDCDTAECAQGESCIEGPGCVPTCSLDDSCDVGEACVETDDCPNDCVNDLCRPACAPTCALSDACVDDDDCQSDYCDREGDASTGVCRPACAETSSCATAQACSRSADCAEGTCEATLCHPPCGTGATCTPGSACAVSADCVGDDICHPGDHVCLTSCSGRTLASQADFEAVRYCWELDGNVEVNPVPALATIGPDVLPYLTDITGTLTLAGGATVDSITLPALSVVAQGFGTGNNFTGELHFPALLQLGTFGSAMTNLTVALTTATVIDMPKLSTVFGNVFMTSLPNLTTVNLHSLAAVHGNFVFQGTDAVVTTVQLDSLDTRFDISGEVTISQFPNIPWTTFDFILPLNGNETVSNIGCNTDSACNCGNTSCVPPP